MLTNDIEATRQTIRNGAGAMTASVAQQRVSRDLLEAEAALDEALLRQAQLLSTMVHVRRETGFAPFTGQDALMRLVRSQQAMVNAGGELARVHGRLSDIAVAIGGDDPCPSKHAVLDDTWADSDLQATAEPFTQSRAA